MATPIQPFTIDTEKLKSSVQKVRSNRNKLLDKSTLNDLNVYRNFGIFPTYTDTYYDEYVEDGTSNDTGTITKVKNGKKVTEPITVTNKKYKHKDPYTDGNGPGTPGVRSIFNRSGAIVMGARKGFNTYYMRPELGEKEHTSYWRIANNVPLMDSPKARQRIRSSAGCSVKELVSDSRKGLMGKETYAYSDFMYCKHLGKVSNNYLITLRRFPTPVDDYIGALGTTVRQRSKHKSKNSLCVGCMVTWMGVSGNEMSNILKYNYKQPFKEEEAQWEQAQVPVDADASTGILPGLFSIFDSSYRQQYQAGYASNAANSAFSYFGVKGLGQAPYKNLAGMRDERTKVWGPIDSIRHVYMRADKGLTFEQKFTLVFEYELRSYNGINGKQAMLDLISNILHVTYTTGSFWGGGYKGFGAHQSNIFANLNVFKAKGGFSNFVDAFAKDLTNLKGRITSYFSEGEGAVSQLLKLLDTVGGMLMSGFLNNLGRPQKGFANALLSPAPVGLWHVTIGNPKRPIMSIGNMIITNVQFEHNGVLGIDDFPTGIKVTVDLDRGKARDLRDIERLYMQGNDRIYSSMSEKIYDMYKNAYMYKKEIKSDKGLDNYDPKEETSSEIDLKKLENPDESDGSEYKVSITNEYSDNTTGVYNFKKYLTKYFGTSDAFEIYVPAAEQEWGSARTSERDKKLVNTARGNQVNN